MSEVKVNMIWPEPIPSFATYVQHSLTSTAIDATGEKIALMGQVFWNDDDNSKDIRKIHFCFGTVVKAGGSGLIVSLQDIDLTAATPMRPDGTQDQTVAIANGDAAFLSGTWYTTANLNVDRTVVLGELLSAVIEYDGAGRLGADSVAIRHMFPNNAGAYEMQAGVAVFTSAWALVSSGYYCNLIFEFSDGTFGGLSHALISNIADPTFVYSNASTPDEYAMKFNLPFDCKINGLHVLVDPALTGRDYELVLYDSDGSTVLASKAFDTNAAISNIGRFATAKFAEISYLKNTNKYLAVKPTTAGSNRISYHSLNHADHRQALVSGTHAMLSSRVNAGAWTDDATKVPIGFHILISKINDGASAGGGAYAHASMV